MKEKICKVLLILGYLIPFVFLAMNEDATYGSLWFYLVMPIGFFLLGLGCIKIKTVWIVVAGNILSFMSSCVFSYFFQTEKWEYYFKPFLPCQLMIFETIFVFLVQIAFVVYYRRKFGKS